MNRTFNRKFDILKIFFYVKYAQQNIELFINFSYGDI